MAAYIAATLSRIGREADWPDGISGNAARLLTQDLGEFAEAMVACGRANYWSPAKALERMFAERVEVLMGASADQSVAKRYLDSVVTAPTESRPNRPAKKARPEDALGQFFARADVTADDRAGFRASWLELKDLASKWFVHPTAMGPLLSRGVREDGDDAVDHWVLLIQLLASGCLFSLAAANPLGVTLPVEAIRSLHAAGAYLQRLGKPVGDDLLEIHGFLGERVVQKPI
ncbi:MAG: hypothetical protein KJ053_05485 [Dehalococcoidia bacterium]|nr:hypothetical protein [Dehalococcoidia bacterium]